MSTANRLPLLFRTALRGVTMHKLRSLLTILGLVFGVSSVIVMLAVAQGASVEAQNQIAALGINNVILRSVKPVIDDTNRRDDNRVMEYGLSYSDLRRISEGVPDVISATPLREYRREARNGRHFLDARIVAVQPDYFVTNRLKLERGRFLQNADLTRRTNVCVLGNEIARRLFPGESPLGKSVQVGNRHFYRIVGVQANKTPSAGIGSSLAAQDLNLDVVVPLTTDRSREGDVLMQFDRSSFSLERLELSQITVTVTDAARVKPAAAALEGLLARSRQQKDFAVTIPLDLLEQAQATQRIFNFVLGATAAISLLVGGIGIMNIMLASISERTREIGIRRALGARRSDIITQFLLETGMLSFLGSLLGVLAGVSAPRVVSALSGMETIVTPGSVVIAAAVAMATGIGFGIYPARLAAQLDPIEALRHE